MTAPPGSNVGIYYDGAKLSPGEALITPTGRAYIVVSVRVQTRGAHAGRQHLRCIVAEKDDELPPVRRSLIWYKRGR